MGMRSASALEKGSASVLEEGSALAALDAAAVTAAPKMNSMPHTQEYPEPSRRDCDRLDLYTAMSC